MENSGRSGNIHQSMGGISNGKQSQIAQSQIMENSGISACQVGDD